MADPARSVERTYLGLTLLTTLASSFIWGINTIFLLNAGLSNAEAFAANAFFTVGEVIFEIPTGVVADTRLLALLGLTGNFYVALLLLAAWAFVFAVESPLRQAFINGLIPSEQRATVLSFDSLMGSTGGVVAQPALGRVADIGGYGASIVVSAGIQALALPFVLLARREHAVSDPIHPDEASGTGESSAPPGHLPLDGDQADA